MTMTSDLTPDFLFYDLWLLTLTSTRTCECLECYSDA